MPLKQKLVEIVGEKNVLDAPDILESRSTDCSLLKGTAPDYVVRPGNATILSELVKLSNETGLPLIPSSSSIHFYGSTLPKYGGAIIDLSPMNKILELDERNRMVKLEPGVTWSQLSQELEKAGLFAVPPLLPHPDRSVLTTYLEREPFLIHRYEFGDPLLGMEVVLPSGDIFRTGSASVPGFPQSFCQGANPQGPGCMDFYRLLQGAQGTFGVVTWANIKVEYLPTADKAFFIPFHNLNDVPVLLYKIGKLRIGYELFLLNSLNWAILFGEGKKAEDKNLGSSLPPYILTIIISGIRRHPEERVSYEEKALDKIFAEDFKHLEKFSSAPGLPELGKKLPQILRRPSSHEDIFWKFRHKGAVHELFFISTLERAPALINEGIYKAREMDFDLKDLGIYIQPVEYGSGCHCEFDFYYDPASSKAREQIQNVHDETAIHLLSLGAHFTRPYGSLARITYNKAADYALMLKKIKNIFDPNNILCPGNLCF